MRKSDLGIWLDHMQAYLVWVDSEGKTRVRYEEVEETERGLRPGLAFSGGTGKFGAMAPHTDPNGKRHLQAVRLYETICKAARDAHRVYIFGPGVAKKEMEKKLLEHKDFTGRIAALESADRMTQPQIEARVKKFFHAEKSAA